MTGKHSKYSFLIFFVLFMMTAISSLRAEDADELYREGRFADAEKVYQKADMDNPRDIRYRYNRGCAAYQNSDYKAAAAAFTSVLRRAKEDDMLYRASYNLGNTAFVQGDFSSAVQFYKKAIVHNPNSDAAKYNLELSLKKLSESKGNQNQDQGDKQNKNGDQKQKQDNGEKKKSGNDNKKDNQGDNTENNKEKNKKQDLSGDLSGANEMDKKENQEANQTAAAALLDKKKADALLDNIKEDRAKIMKFQTPEDKNQGAGSGKDW